MSSSGYYQKRSRYSMDDDDAMDDESAVLQQQPQLDFVQLKRQVFDERIREANAWLEEEYKEWVPKLEKPQLGVEPSAESKYAEDELQFLNYEYLRAHKNISDMYNPPAGYVVIMGSNETRQLGRPDEVENSDTPVDHQDGGYLPMLVQGIPAGKFVHVAAGGVHTAALTDDGQVYTWGANEDGAVGRPTGTEAPAVVKGFYPCDARSEKDKEDGQIIDVQAGIGSLLFLTIKGNVYTCGIYRDASGAMSDVPRDRLGRPGNNPFTKSLAPIHIPLHQKVRLIAKGENFNAALLADGITLVTWGWGTRGQLARSAGMATPEADGTYNLDKLLYVEGEMQADFAVQKMLTPAPVIYGRNPHSPKIVLSVACGGGHLLVVARDEGSLEPIVYGSGNNIDGQLGLGEDIPQVHELTVIPGLRHENIVKVAAGTDFSLALDHYQYKLFSFGICDKNQLGLFNESRATSKEEETMRVFYPTRVLFPGTETVRIQEIKANDSNCAVLTDDGDLYTWGFNELLQTGHDIPIDVTRPRKLVLDILDVDVKKVLHLSVGGSHAAMIVDVNHGDRNV